ncbi:MAG: hypothetical protein ACR2HA_02770 [Nocardioides sp.]
MSSRPVVVEAGATAAQQQGGWGVDFPDGQFIALGDRVEGSGGTIKLDRADVEGAADCVPEVSRRCHSRHAK